MPRILIAVRTHKADDASLAAYDLYATVKSAAVTFSVDERAGAVDVGGRRKTGFDLDWLNTAGLFPHPQCGWRCGDYNYYRLRQSYPDFDYYWLIEPDVVINVDDINGFFEQFTADTADYLAGRFGKRQGHWDWHAEVSPDYPDVYGGVFPITRLSGRAIDFLFSERRRLSALVGPAKPVRWPNDESFVASALVQAGFTGADLNAENRVVRTEISLRTGVVHDTVWLAAHGRDGLIYHPVRPLGPILEKAETSLTRFHKFQAGAPAPRGEAQWLGRTARSCLGHPDLADAALVPLVLMRELFGAPGDDTPAPPNKAMNPTARAASEAANLYRRHFGAGAGKTSLGIVHAARPKKAIGAYTTAGAEDFDLGRGFPLMHFPKRFALPFAFDFDAESLAHTVHIQPHVLLREPFLYVAQREKSHAVAHVKWKHLADIHGTPRDDARPVLIFSIGRTGSTLLGKLIGCMTPRAFLEPDTITQLALHHARLQALPPAVRAQLVWSAVAPFFDTYLQDNADGRCVVKLRSQANALAAEMAASFPQARFVFMLRERGLWARSTYRAFRISPEAVAGRLVAGVRAVRDLRDAGVDLEVVNYEDVVADPQTAVGRIMGQDITADPAIMARLADVMAQDSQADAKIAQTNTSRVVDGEAEWLAAFEARWQQNRPHALIEALGLVI